MTDFLADALLYVVPLLFGVILHEVAHGWVAERCGDPTARGLGRITLNPLAHIDLMGTIILPILLLVSRSPFLFGWAKPVPVDFGNLRGGRLDMAKVALSGPLANLLLVVLSAGLYHLILLGTSKGVFQEDTMAGWLVEPVFRMAYYSVRFNLVLTMVNLLPLPPLDGGHFLMGILPERWAAALGKMEPFGILLVLILLGSGAWGYVFSPVFRTVLRILTG